MLAHVPVLWREAIEILNVRPDGFYIDATLGAGGHAEGILRRLESGKLLGIDRDPAALAAAQERLRSFGEKLIVMRGNFARIGALHEASGLPLADGLLADLGMSSLQVEDASRGFSFNTPGPLDMRMDPTTGATAADLVNQMSERELADLIFKLGEERHSRRIARAMNPGFRVPHSPPAATPGRCAWQDECGERPPGRGSLASPPAPVRWLIDTDGPSQ